jgi:L-aminopeptidase/D-esterase-like protein
VPAAILFDLVNGGDKDWGMEPPYRALGIAACEAAGPGFALGNAGAGLGAVAGSVKGGLGSASATLPGGAVVGALVAVNSFGSVFAPGSGTLWAAPYERDGEFAGQAGSGPLEPGADPRAGTKRDAARAGANTTIGIVATDVDLTQAEAQRLAIMAQDGLARAIRPVHTPVDGDTIFALATGARSLGDARALALAELGGLAADVMARAVARAVVEAESVAGIPAWRDRTGP